MKFGLQIDAFKWPGGDQAIGPTLGRVVTTAEAAGSERVHTPRFQSFTLRGRFPCISFSVSV